MKTRFACLSRITLLCLLLAAPAVAESILYSVGATSNEWSFNHRSRVADLYTLAGPSRATGFDFSVSQGWQGDALLAAQTRDISTLFSGLVSGRIARFRFPVLLPAVPPTALPPDAVPPDPVPEPSSLLVLLGAGILGLAYMLATKLKTTRALN
jgi:PEP-CTERM motif-containing protein